MARRMLGATLIIFGCLLVLPGVWLLGMIPLPGLSGAFDSFGVGGAVLLVAILLIRGGSKMRAEKPPTEPNEWSPEEGEPPPWTSHKHQ